MSEECCCCEEDDDELQLLGPNSHTFVYDDNRTFSHRAPKTAPNGRIVCQWTNAAPGVAVGAARLPKDCPPIPQGKYDVVWTWSGKATDMQSYVLMPQADNTQYYVIQWFLGDPTKDMAAVTTYTPKSDGSVVASAPQSIKLSAVDPDCYVAIGDQTVVE